MRKALDTAPIFCAYTNKTEPTSSIPLDKLTLISCSASPCSSIKFKNGNFSKKQKKYFLNSFCLLTIAQSAANEIITSSLQDTSFVFRPFCITAMVMCMCVLVTGPQCVWVCIIHVCMWVVLSGKKFCGVSESCSCHCSANACPIHFPGHVT